MKGRRRRPAWIIFTHRPGASHREDPPVILSMWLLSRPSSVTAALYAATSSPSAAMASPGFRPARTHTNSATGPKLTDCSSASSPPGAGSKVVCRSRPADLAHTTRRARCQLPMGARTRYSPLRARRTFGAKIQGDTSLGVLPARPQLHGADGARKLAVQLPHQPPDQRIELLVHPGGSVPATDRVRHLRPGARVTARKRHGTDAPRHGSRRPGEPAPGYLPPRTRSERLSTGQSEHAGRTGRSQSRPGAGEGATTSWK